MSDAAIDKKETVAAEEVTSTETAKESPVKKSPPAKKAETNGTAEHENGSGDAPADTPAENGDAEAVETKGATKNGDAKEKKETGVKRKSVAGEGDVVEKSTPEKKSKVAEDAPPEDVPEEVAA